LSEIGEGNANDDAVVIRCHDFYASVPKGE